MSGARQTRTRMRALKPDCARRPSCRQNAFADRTEVTLERNNAGYFFFSFLRAECIRNTQLAVEWANKTRRLIRVRRSASFVGNADIITTLMHHMFTDDRRRREIRQPRMFYVLRRGALGAGT